METKDAMECLSSPISWRNHSCDNIMIIEVMDKEEEEETLFNKITLVNITHVISI